MISLVMDGKWCRGVSHVTIRTHLVEDQEVADCIRTRG